MTEIEAIGLARAGNTEAFRTLFAQHKKMIFKRCLKLANGDEQLAQDMLQEAFLSAWQSIQLFRGQSNFGTWLHTIATYEGVRILKVLDKSPEMLAANIQEEGDGGPKKGEDPVDCERLAYVKTMTDMALARLNSNQADCVRRNFLEGLTAEEIAEQDGVPLGTVKGRIKRGLKKMRRILVAGERGATEGDEQSDSYSAK